MPRWVHTIDLNPVFSKYEDDEVQDHIEELKDQTVTILKENLSIVKAIFEEEVVEEYTSIIEHFSQISNLEEYNFVLDDLFNLGDLHRLWIKTYF